MSLKIIPLTQERAAQAETLQAAWLAAVHGSVAGIVAVSEEPDGALRVWGPVGERAWRDDGTVAAALPDEVHAWAASQGYQQLVATALSVMDTASTVLDRCDYRTVGTEGSGAGAVLWYRRPLSVRPIGERLPLDPPGDAPEGALFAIVERPRGYIEGWRHHPGAQELVLDEHYDRPVPVNYGFAPEWINPADGDELDVIILDDARMQPGQALTCLPTGVVHRPDGDHKLLAIPSEGAERPVSLDDGIMERVNGWWEAPDKPTGWAGIEAVPSLLAQCRHHTYKG